MPKKLTQKEFINKAKQIHGNKYDYSLVDYKNNKTKVKIICPEHGIFEQSPKSHINKMCGCSICSGIKKLTQKEFIEKAKQIHGNKYNYNLVKYKNNKTKVKIICPKHGMFEQTPNKHLSWQGCIICSGSIKLTFKEFINKAKQIHGNKYDYSLVDYKNNKTKIKIICPKHGIFEQIPNAHLNGQGCIICSGRFNYTTKEFIEKAKVVHGDKYDYSLVDYKNNYTKVKIICPKHGIFEQSFKQHISLKHGCPICNESKGERVVAKYLNSKNIQYIREHRFNDCVNKQPLPFDFYLPNKNILIEFDGKQHYEPVKFFGGEKGLKYRQQNDTIKTEYCMSNNIKLIRINYIKDVINILDNELNGV